MHSDKKKLTTKKISIRVMSKYEVLQKKDHLELKYCVFKAFTTRFIVSIQKREVYLKLLKSIKYFVHIPSIS